jgi:hypothetical protein
VADVLETGDIHFLVRPRVDRERPRTLDDVQRLLVVLRPWPDGLLRLLVVGRKRLPEITGHERFWSFVDTVGRRPEDLREAVGSRTYWTRTRGVRTQPAARAAGDGAYVVARHDTHTHLAYALHEPEPEPEPEPERENQLRRDLNIEPVASFIATVLNPAARVPARLARVATREPDLPPEVMERFGDRRFVPLEPPELLDHAGIHLVLIGAARDVATELDLDLNAALERDTRALVFDDVTSLDASPEPLFAPGDS